MMSAWVFLFGEKQPGHTWVAEMSLWTPWTHMGDLISEDVSRVVVLHMEQFCVLAAGA